jgi:hypothetical protein
MGKYLSKGSDDCLGQFVADLGYESVPGQWWFASAQMKQWVKKTPLEGGTLGHYWMNTFNTRSPLALVLASSGCATLTCPCLVVW